MRRKKLHINKLPYISAILLCIVVIIGGGLLAYAAMTAKDKKVNDFHVGDVKVAIEEVFNASPEIKPGLDIKKEVKFTNKGTISQFLRVMIHPEALVDSSTDPAAYKQVLPMKIGKELLLDLNTQDWIDGEDGYYYYTKAIPAKQATKELFTKVQLDSNLAKMYHDGYLTITIKAEAINCAQGAYVDAWFQGVVPTNGPLKTVDDTLKTQVEQ